MKERNDLEICADALETFGAENQTRMMFEDMSELTKELCKNARGRDNRDAIAEEIADVEIMLMQMKLLHSVEEDVESYKEKKMARLQAALDKRHAKVGGAHE